ncbi:MAG: TolB family protein, partial [Thermoleophilaceae bacterium]
MDFSRFVPVVLVLLAALLWTTTASATFPGENGKLTFELSQMFTVNPNGSALTPLAPEGGVVGDEPAFSPDGRLIAFDFAGAPAGTTGWGIWVMSNTGTGARQVTGQSQAVASQDTYPFWSPDGQHIGFVRDRDILVMDADGSTNTPDNLTENFLNAAIDPDWSPRGDLIAFSDGGDVYVVPADGSSDPVMVPTPIANDRYPSWSPDGGVLAYATNTEVRRVAPDGSNNTAIASGFSEVWDLAWSPDGTQIAFINDGGNPQVQEELYLVTAAGSGAAPVGVDTSTNLDWGVAAQGPPPPIVGETATVREVKGRVFVGIPSTGARAAQKGVDFIPLEEARDIPIGAFLDTRKGTVGLSTARNRAGKIQSGKFSAGLFQVLQSRKRAAKGLTELR